MVRLFQSTEPEERFFLTELSSEPPPEPRVATSNPPQTLDRETIPALPGFNPLEPPSFYWGKLDATTLSLRIDKAYQQIVYWEPNLFKLPSGISGVLFVKSVASLLSAYAEGTVLASFALKAATCMPSLLLQRPHNRSKNADHQSPQKQAKQMTTASYCSTHKVAVARTLLTVLRRSIRTSQKRKNMLQRRSRAMATPEDL